MHLTECINAWEHRATRRAWFKCMAMNVFWQIGWPAAFLGLLYVMVIFTSRMYVILFAPFILYSLYRAVSQIGHFRWVFRMRRILQHYPWQMLEKIPRSLERHPEARDEGAWLEFCNPVNSEQKIPLVFIRHQRTHWWLKRIGHVRTRPELKAQIEPIWFSGDPRFLGVIAAPGRVGGTPRRFHVLYQRSVFDRRCASQSWAAGSADIERARRAGAVYLDNFRQSQT